MSYEQNLSSSSITTGPQFEEALQTAESLMKQADRQQEKADRVLAAEIGTVAIAVAISAIVAILGPSPHVLNRGLVLLIGTAAGLIIAAALHARVRQHLVNQSRRDGQAAIYIVNLLREVVMIITDTEGWNTTQVRLARARLSRFPIGVAGISDE